MSDAREQAFIDAPVEVVWDLVSNVERHPEWWPRIVEVECEELEEGCTYREVVKGPVGRQEFDIRVVQLQDCKHLAIRCLNTGTFVRMHLTAAQGGTFVDARMGMEPRGATNRVFDAIAGKRYFKSWIAQTITALKRVAGERSARV